MNTKHILLIDDNKCDAADISKLLGENGYSVSCAHNGRDALERLKEEKFDLIILELLLPDIKGEEICSRLKRSIRYKKVPIIILSSKDEAEDVEALFEKGADAYIIKPPNPALLLQKIEAHISK